MIIANRHRSYAARSVCRMVAVTLVLLGYWPPCTFALTDEEIYEAFEFNFSLPGARSAGMGRAFVGLADDATASISNPAGLMTLQVPEVALESKFTGFDVHRRAEADSFLDPRTRRFGSSVPQLSFIGLVYPKGNLVFGVYRYETLRFDEAFSLEARQLPLDGGIVELPPTDAQMALTVSNIGGSVAIRLPENFSLGFSASAALLEMDSRTTHLSTTEPATITDQTIINATGLDWSGTAGLLYRPSERFSAGAFYSLGPSFSVTQRATGLGPQRQEFPVRIRIPDRFGVGLSVRPTDELTVLLDLLKVQYAQQASGRFPTLVRFPELNPDDFTIDDQWEIHLGAEYVFAIGSVPFAARAGLFTNPAHSLRYEGPVEQLEGQIADALFNATAGKSPLAYSVGLGAVFSGYFQVDMAFVNANLFDEAIASVIFHFK